MDLALTLGFTDNQLWLTTPKHQACLIGPASFNLDINAAVYKTHPPTSSVMLSAGVIPLRLGNESISLTEQCVKEVLALLPQKVSPITLVSFSLITLAFISTKNTFMIICFSIKKWFKDNHFSTCCVTIVIPKYGKLLYVLPNHTPSPLGWIKLGYRCCCDLPICWFVKLLCQMFSAVFMSLLYFVYAGEKNKWLK